VKSFDWLTGADKSETTMLISRRDWWLGVIVLAVALVFHALAPRYDWIAHSTAGLMRIDRWTGGATLGTFTSEPRGTWRPVD